MVFIIFSKRSILDGRSAYKSMVQVLKVKKKKKKSKRQTTRPVELVAFYR